MDQRTLQLWDPTETLSSAPSLYLAHTHTHTHIHIHTVTCERVRDVCFSSAIRRFAARSLARGADDWGFRVRPHWGLYPIMRPLRRMFKRLLNQIYQSQELSLVCAATGQRPKIRIARVWCVSNRAVVTDIWRWLTIAVEAGLLGQVSFADDIVFII